MPGSGSAGIVFAMTRDAHALALLSLAGCRFTSADMHLIMQKLADQQVNILDIRQTVLQGEQSFSALLAIFDGPDNAFERLEHSLSETAMKLGFSARLTAFDKRAYRNIQRQPTEARHVVTLLAQRLTGQVMADLTALLAEAGLLIEDICQLTEQAPMAADGRPVCIEIGLKGELKDALVVRAALLDLAGRLCVDIAFQRDDLFRRNRRIIVFDMDSTLIQTEVINELARCAGVEGQVTAITEQAMTGQLSFGGSLMARVHLLKGLSESVFPAIAEDLQLADGAERLIRTLQLLGFRTAIVSGGFRYFGERLQRRLGIDYLYANELEIESGCLTGGLIGEIIDGEGKAKIVRSIADKEGFDLQQVVAIGDGANDLPMLNIAGLGIAYRAKPLVRQAAKQVLSNHGLDSILYLLGMNDAEIAAHRPDG